jgi:hypothetical protein
MKHRTLFLAITSLLAAVGLALSVLFAFMALGGSWYEPNIVIALLEYFASLCLIGLGIVGWIKVVRGN